MNIIPFASESMTMSSREIAELAGKRHDHVMRDFRKMLEALGKDVLSFGAIYKDAYGRDQQEYRLDRELTLTLVSGYDIPLRHRVVTRLAELEQKAAFAGLPDFSNPAAAARAWAEQVEQKAGRTARRRGGLGFQQTVERKNPSGGGIPLPYLP